jgi:branched-chain amino acid transport system ATP-binding protein
MVAISRAMLGAPGLVLLDEGTQGLAPKVVEDVMKTVKRLKAEGVSVLMVEQHAQLALSVSDRAYVLGRGEVKFAGSAEELLHADEQRHALLGI